MPMPLSEALKAAVAETFENMAFMEALPCPSPPETPDEGKSRTVTILIHEPVTGELVLSCPRPLMGKLASAVYALPESSIDDPMLGDLQAEILNTIAGRFLAFFLPERESYRLGLPQQGEGSALPFESEQIWWFEIEGIPLSLFVRGEMLLPYCSNP